MIENADLSRVVSVGSIDPDALKADEWLRCSGFFFMQFNGWEYFYYQHEDASIPNELWAGADVTFKRLIETTPGYVRFSARSQASFEEPFRSYVGQDSPRSRLARPPGLTAFPRRAPGDRDPPSYSAAVSVPSSLASGSGS